MRIIDADGHLYEPRNMWADYSAANDREAAISIVDDKLGYSWITARGRPIRQAYLMWPTAGQDFTAIGQAASKERAGLPNDVVPYDEMPRTFWEPAARRDVLDSWGVDEAVLFPQMGFQWVWQLADDPYALRVNMEAWNRYIVEVAQEGRGRLHPVGHVHLDSDPRWLRSELEHLASNGIKLAMCVPSLVDGRRLSHPDLDPMWRAFTDFGVTPTWHVTSQMQSIFQDHHAWGDNDDNLVRLVTGPHVRVAVEVALTDMAVNGVFERHPSLRIVTAEVGADWFPALCRRIDGFINLHTAVSGRPLCPDLVLAPSEYLQRAVTLVCSLPSDWSPLMLTELADQAAFGGDYPHPEGLADPLRQYQERVGELPEDVSSKIYGGNIEPFVTR